MRELNKKNLVVLSIEVIRAAVVSLVTLNPLETCLGRMILKNILSVRANWKPGIYIHDAI